MSDASTTATNATATSAASASSAVLSTIKAAISEDGQKVVAFFEELEQSTATILSKIESGAEILVADIETLCENINSKLGIITAATSAASTLAGGNAALQKLISDVNAGVQDAAAVSTALSSGSTVGDNSTVTTTVNTLNAVNALAQLASQASQMAGQAAASSSTATQAVSQPTPAQA